nr:type VI secretion system ImpA family N-terminal domain-containing protein [Providencia stuartii]ELR5083422.1 type VI secretion system ImpA family N-terminal domain-containing protein [Providencia stuartii]
MSTQSENLVIKVGGSPLETPEFIALKAEFNKLNHPARPEVSWTLIESLCLALFKNHGIDLQSGIYYTMARLQLHGLSGFTEGCELLASVVVTQWEHLWPEQPHHRADILNWFNSRAGSTLRQLTFDTNDLRLIYRSERALQLIIDKLAQTTWSKVPKLENLLWFFQNSAKNLEQREDSLSKIKSQAVKLPPLVYIQQPKAQQEPPIQSIVIETPMPSEPAPLPIHDKMSATKGFLIGVIASAVVFASIGYPLYYSLKQALVATTSVPEGAAAHWLFKPELASYSDSLNLLEKQSPVFSLKQSDALVDTAKRLWPNDADQAYASRNWQNLITTRLENAPIDNSWSETSSLLQQLSDKIVMQERNRGSFTLSYLKTAIYDIQKQHNKSTPVEEKLREFALQIDSGQPISPTLISNIDGQINGLLARYYELQKQAEKQGLKPNSY